VAALPALVECTADFCRGRFARVFLVAAALGNLSPQPTQPVQSLGCLGHCLYRHAILHGYGGLASQAGGFRYLNQTCNSKRMVSRIRFRDTFGGWVFRIRFGIRFRDAVWRTRFGWFFGWVFWVRFRCVSDGIVDFVGWLRELVLYHNYRLY
jgi:hypothetical protein